ETRAVTAAGGGENREDLLRLLASQKYGLVFGIGFAFAGPVASVAKDFPGTVFGIIDASVPAPNVASLVFAAEQGSCLAGAAPASASSRPPGTSRRRGRRCGPSASTPTSTRRRRRSCGRSSSPRCSNASTSPSSTPSPPSTATSSGPACSASTWPRAASTSP